MDIKGFLSKYPLVKHLLLMLASSIIILFIVFLFIKIYARQGHEYELQDLIGKSLAEVQGDNPLHLEYVIMDSLYVAESEGGIILQQDPKPGTMIKTKRKVYVTVTTYSPEDVVLPELSNMSVKAAVSALESAGLRCGKLKFVDSPYKNVILETTCKGKLVYAGEKMNEGAIIDLTVGLGSERSYTTVPFVIGQNPVKARRTLLKNSLNVGTEHFDNVSDRNNCVVYRLEPDYTGVTRYPLGTYVELWYCDASEADIENIINNFRVDSSKIVDDAESLGGFDEDYDQNDWLW